MDEVRRFLRFSIPGIVAIIELLISLAIADNSSFAELIKSIDNYNSFGLILGLLLGSGGLGYIFANIYLSLIWLPWLRNVFAIDHLRLFRDLEGKLNILDSHRKAISPEELSQRDAWTITSRYWYSQLKGKENYEIKGINVLTDRLTDHAHALGATIIGAILAGLTWYYIYSHIWNNTPCLNFEFLIPFFSFIILLALISHAYFLAKTSLENMANSTIINKVLKQSGCVNWYYSKRKRRGN
jgi:hypothetical protein